MILSEKWEPLFRIMLQGARRNGRPGSGRPFGNKAPGRGAAAPQLLLMRTATHWKSPCRKTRSVTTR